MTGTVSDRRVEGGLWWNGGTWTIRSVPEAGGTLPETGAPWRRVPGWLLFPLAPVVGGAFVVALPLLGAYLVAEALTRAAVGRGGRAARDLAATVAAPAPRPGEAHLGGPAGAGSPEPLPPDEAAPNQGLDEVEASASKELDEVEAEVEARREG